MTNPKLVPVGNGRRFFARLIENLFQYIPAFGMLALWAEWGWLIGSLAIIAYHILFYWAFGGHLGHLILGCRIVDFQTGRRIKPWQALVRTCYEITIFTLAFLAGLALGLTLPENPDLSDIVRMESTANILDRLVPLIVFLPMALMVLNREDCRHAFDLLSRSIVIKKSDVPTVHSMEGNPQP